ncbi:MAG: hypothetical protein ABII07_03765 [Patescibacteria group bacterium]|nr:hypothetical protein [Patescibacteria group bacterium]
MTLPESYLDRPELTDENLIQLGADPQLFDETHRKKLLATLRDNEERGIIGPGALPHTPEDTSHVFKALFGRRKNPTIILNHIR